MTFSMCSHIRQQDIDASIGLSKDVVSFSLIRCDMGKGGFLVRCGGSLGGGLCTPWSSSNGPYHCRLHGGVCPQEPDFLVKKERRLGKDDLLLLVCMFP